jgi:hypothetical protein
LETEVETNRPFDAAVHIGKLTDYVRGALKWKGAAPQ